VTTHIEAAESAKLSQKLPKALVLAPLAVFLKKPSTLYSLEVADPNTSRLWIPKSGGVADFSLPDLRLCRNGFIGIM
jgi:hypothetical protein